MDNTETREIAATKNSSFYIFWSFYFFIMLIFTLWRSIPFLRTDKKQCLMLVYTFPPLCESEQSFRKNLSSHRPQSFQTRSQTWRRTSFVNFLCLWPWLSHGESILSCGIGAGFAEQSRHRSDGESHKTRLKDLSFKLISFSPGRFVKRFRQGLSCVFHWSLQLERGIARSIFSNFHIWNKSGGWT